MKKYLFTLIAYFLLCAGTNAQEIDRLKLNEFTKAFCDKFLVNYPNCSSSGIMCWRMTSLDIGKHPLDIIEGLYQTQRRVKCYERNTHKLVFDETKNDYLSIVYKESCGRITYNEHDNCYCYRVGDSNIYVLKPYFGDEQRIVLENNGTTFSFTEKYSNDFEWDVETKCIKLQPTAAMYDYYLKGLEKLTKNNSQDVADQENEWSGTGFALSKGYIVTNHHVIEGAETITVLGVNGTNKEYQAKIIASDKNNDLAIIKITDQSFIGFGNVPYKVSSRICDVGEDVFVLGYPLTQYMGDEIKLTNGIISSKTGYQGDVSTYQISAPIQPGNSGGALFDSKGNVIGIVNAGIKEADNVGYAIKTPYLNTLLSSTVSSNILPQSNTNLASLSLAEKVKKIKNFVFFIKCKGNK